MIDKFWDALGKKLADRLLTASVPAVVFWLSGLLAWLWSQRGTATLREPSRWLATQPVIGQILVIVLGLLAVAGSGLLVEYLAEQLLRLAQANLPQRLAGLRRGLDRRARADDARWQELALQADGNASALSAADHDEWRRLDRRKRARGWSPDPGRDTRRSKIPATGIGAVLRAVESRVQDKYGLEAVAMWPRLWLLLPEHARKDVASARSAVTVAASVVIWGCGMLGFAWLTLWTVPVGAVVAAAAYRIWLPNRVEVLAETLESCFDLYRMDLYRQLRWPLPASPAEEHACGLDVTRFIWRGSHSDVPRYTEAP